MSATAKIAHMAITPQGENGVGDTYGRVVAVTARPEAAIEFGVGFASVLAMQPRSHDIAGYSTADNRDLHEPQVPTSLVSLDCCGTLRSFDTS